MQRKQFFLNSKNAISNTTNIWNISDPTILYPRRNLRLYVKSTWFEFVYNPINTTNNILYFTENAVNRVLTIPSGNYTAYSLLTTIQNLLNTGGAQTYSILYDPIKLLYTISTTGGLNFKIMDGANSIHKNIGFTNFQSSTTSIVSNIPINIIGPKYIYMLANLSYFNTSDNNQNILNIIPLNGNYGEVIYYEDPNPPIIPLGTSTYTNITIEIRDENDNLFILNENSSFLIHLVFEWDE